MPFFRTQPYNRNWIDWPEPYFCFTARVILKLLTCPLRLNDGIVSPRSTVLRGWEGWPVLFCLLRTPLSPLKSFPRYHQLGSCYLLRPHAWKTRSEFTFYWAYSFLPSLTGTTWHAMDRLERRTNWSHVPFSTAFPASVDRVDFLSLVNPRLFFSSIFSYRPRG